MLGPGSNSALGVLGAVRVWIDGVQVHDGPILASPGPTGALTLSTEVDLEGITVAWTYALDADPASNAVLNGKTVITNLLPQPKEIVTELLVPLCPKIQYDAGLGHPKPKIGGSVIVRINADADGGSITCAPGFNEVTAALGTEGEVTQSLFFCPFNLSLSGAGTASTGLIFGSPYPSTLLSKPLDDFGHRVAVTLTPGDKATITMLQVVSGHFEPLPVSTCPPDVNLDWSVDGGDLAAVLADFGSPATCGNRADINDDGLIDGQDLAAVLAAWGVCQPGA